MRTHYCGLVSAAQLDQTVTLCGWVNTRRDHGGVIFIDLRDREGLVQIVCNPTRPRGIRGGGEDPQRIRDPGDRQGDPARAGAGESEAEERRDRGAVPGARDPQPGGDAAVPARRRKPVGDHPPHPSRDRPAPAADAGEPAPALQGGDGGAPLPGRGRVHRHRDADAGQVHPRGRARLPGAFARARRHVLRAAAVAAAVQADADDRGFRPLLPDHQVLPRRGSARRPPARVHPDRYRNLVPGGGGNPRHHGSADAQRVQAVARCGSARSLAGHDLCRGDGALRLGQAGPARGARVHRAHRRHEKRRVQGVLRRRPTRPAGASRACAFPAAARSRAARSTPIPSSSASTAPGASPISRSTRSPRAAKACSRRS